MLGSNKILVAYDGSLLAEKALGVAFDMAQANPKAAIDVVFVEDVALMRNGVEAVDEGIQRKDNAICDALTVKLKAWSGRVRLHRLRGQETPYVVLHFAEENGSDLIIVGSRGLTGLREFLGSVSHEIVQKSSVPVLVIK